VPGEVGEFHARYRRVLRAPAAEEARVAAALRARVGGGAVLVVSLSHRHDQTTIWWFEQGLLSLLAAAGLAITLVTDARYGLDHVRLGELGARLEIVRWRRGGADLAPLARRGYGFAVALSPSDEALALAEAGGLPLVAFAVKEFEDAQPPLRRRPPGDLTLWHAFAGSRNFPCAAGRALGAHAAAWRLEGAPFPVNRYYFPAAPAPGPASAAAAPAGGEAAGPIDALIFGSQGRDLGTAFRALAHTGARRVAVLGNPEHLDEVRAAATAAGIAVEVHGPARHLDLLRLVERSRVVLNPILPPLESHYSLAIPLAVGRPVVTNETPAAGAFVDPAHPGVTLVPPGDEAALVGALQALADPAVYASRCRAAREQARTRHDMARFFAAAMAATVAGPAAGRAAPADGAGGARR
ncbi:MAG TPA: hypothetical protein VGQ83_34515, partial [Polyangia bacterium]|jgi:glycosyltransferase involved in cell wall biosynthesis